MDFDQLRTFLEVSRQKSFSRAAEKLHVTQPSISAQIRSLETYLHHRLLDRGGGKVTLTAAGRIFEPFAEDCLLRLKHVRLMLADMERLLRRVIALKPDHQHAYNALGYSLAERNVRLPEARQLIQKALEYAPADPFIKDSLGWVEFRLGNKAEALKIFEAAYKAKPDAEIAAHFGEVLWSMGQRDKAVAVWKEGRLLNPDNDTLLETLKRLRVKL